MIADASTLIIFGKIKKLDLLFECFQALVITKGVYTECCIDGLAIQAPDALFIDEYVKQSRIVVVTLSGDLVQKVRQLQSLYPQLGNGEAESITLAFERKEPSLLLDDKLARQVATLHGLKPLGTLHILMRLYKEHMLQKQEVKGMIKLLLQHKFRLSSDVLAAFWDLLDKD